MTANTNGTAGKKKGAKSANGRQQGRRRLAKSWNNMGTEETNKIVCGLISAYLVKLVKPSSASSTRRAELVWCSPTFGLKKYFYRYVVMSESEERREDLRIVL